MKKKKILRGQANVEQECPELSNDLWHKILGDHWTLPMNELLKSCQLVCHTWASIVQELTSTSVDFSDKDNIRKVSFLH